MNLPNDLSLTADQAWAKMIIQEGLDKDAQTDDFDLLKTQEFELPELT